MSENDPMSPDFDTIVKDRHEHGIPIAGWPAGLSPRDWSLAGEDHVNDRMRVTLVDWARLTMLGCRLVPHRPENPQEPLTREELAEIGAAIYEYIGRM